MVANINIFKVDGTGRITHMADFVDNAKLDKKQNPMRKPNSELEWVSLSHDELAGACGTVQKLRNEIKMFDVWADKWTVPTCDTPKIDFDNLRQIFNPYGSGTHTCEMAGLARTFIEAVLAFPRFVTPGGEIELGGADYLTASETAGCDHNAGRGKHGAGRTKGAATGKPHAITPGAFDADAFFEDMERREFGFTRKVAAFKVYVEWIGKHAGCGGAAQDVVLAFDRLLDSIGYYGGIDGLERIDRDVGVVQGALAELCRALGDAETAGCAKRSNNDNADAVTRTEIGALQTGVSFLVNERLNQKRMNSKRGKEAQKNMEPEVADMKDKAAADMKEALAKVSADEGVKAGKHGTVLAACRRVCKRFRPLTTKRTPAGDFAEYAPLTDWQGNTIQPETLARNFREMKKHKRKAKPHK